MSWVAVAIGGSALVGAGAGIYSSKQAAKAAKGSASQQQLERQMADNLRQTSPMALDLLRQSTQGYDSAERYWKRLQQGDRSSVLNLLSPTIQQQDQMQRASALQALQLGGRGGGSAEGRLGMMDSMQQNRNNAIMGLQTSAPQMLAGLAGERANLGSALLGQTQSGGSGLLGSMMQRQQMGYNQGRDTGAALFEAMKFVTPYAQNYLQNRQSANTAQQFNWLSNNPGAWGGTGMQ